MAPTAGFRTLTPLPALQDRDLDEFGCGLRQWPIRTSLPFALSGGHGRPRVDHLFSTRPPVLDHRRREMDGETAMASAGPKPLLGDFCAEIGQGAWARPPSTSGTRAGPER